MRTILLVAFAASCGLAAGDFAVAVLAISGVAYPGVFAGEPMVLASVGTVAARFLGREVLAA